MIHRKAKATLNTTAAVVAGCRDAIAVDIDADDGKCFRALTDIRANFGSHNWTLRRGKRWNGADIPRLGQALLGVSQHDPRVVLASGFHDDVCEQANQGKVMRVIGDAIFVALLMPIEFNGKELDGVGTLRAVTMYAGVRAYSVYVFLKRLILNSRQPR